jgi:hypothetical protein
MEEIDKATFKKIFRDHWDEFKQTHPRYDGPEYDQVIQKMLDCGDPEKMGFVQYRCCSCGESRRIAFTCKSCFCLSCAKVYADRWADFIGRRLIPQVTYRHEVFTVPDFLRGYFYRNPDLLNRLLQTGNNCLRDILQTCTRTSLTLGTIIVLQTSGRSGRYNPHLHILFTAGGVDPQGRWKPVSYIPYELMHRKWQYHLLTMLAQEVDPPTIQAQIDQGWKDYPKGFQRIRYYGLHANAGYARNREALAALWKTRTPPADPRGFRMLPRAPFAQRFEKSFGQDPRTCPTCGDTLQRELIYHPRYGILKEFRLFTEMRNDEPFTEPTRPEGRTVDRTQRMVQIPLPFL